MTHKDMRTRVKDLEERALHAAAPIADEWIKGLAGADLDLIVRIAKEPDWEERMTPDELQRLGELNADMLAAVGKGVRDGGTK